MTKELQKELTPYSGAIDHQMEFLTGAKPTDKGPYRMEPPELAELRRK